MQEAAAMVLRVHPAEATEGKMITNPVAVTVAAAMADNAAVAAAATATVPEEVAVALEVVTKAVATAVAPATRVVIIAKVTEKWSRRKTPSSCRA